MLEGELRLAEHDIVEAIAELRFIAKYARMSAGTRSRIEGICSGLEKNLNRPPDREDDRA